MKKPLNAPVFLQRAPKDCGLATIAGVLQYDGKPFDYDAMNAHFKTDAEDFPGLYIPEIGLYFLDQGYDVTMQVFGVHMFSRQHKDMSQPELRQHMQFLKDEYYPSKWQTPLQRMGEFMNNGGLVEVKIPTVDDIRAEIDRDRPVIASVTNAFMGFKPRFGHNMHFVTFVGYDDDGLYVNDPFEAYGHGQTYHYTTEEALFAIHANAAGDVDNCSILKITPRP